MSLQIPVKNEDECKNIPEDELFISESGYAYSILEIASFIRGGEIFNQYKSDFEIPGIFRDFKNVEQEEKDAINRKEGRGWSLNLFTKKDIDTLMQHQVIRDALDAHKDHEALQRHILFLRKY